MFVEALNLGLEIPPTAKWSAKVKELYEFGLIKAKQIEDAASGELIWVCKGLSEASKSDMYMKKATRTDAMIADAHLRMSRYNGSR